jgi:hypothetical protein
MEFENSRPVEIDGRIIGALLGAAAASGLSPLFESPDPLAGTVLAYFGMSSFWIPAAIAGVYGWVMLKRLRRLRLRKNKLRRRSLSFMVGVSVGLIPALFYFCLQGVSTNTAPLAAMFWRGLLVALFSAWLPPVISLLQCGLAPPNSGHMNAFVPNKLLHATCETHACEQWR